MGKTILISGFLVFMSLSCNVLRNENKDNNLTETLTNNETTNKKSIQSENTYLIAFYNVENLFDTINDPLKEDEEFTPNGYKQWTKSRYNKKITNLARVLSNMSNELPALIGLCEVENEQVVRDLSMSEELYKGNYEVVHEESPDTRGIDVALMYRKDLFKYISHISIPVIITNAPDAKLRDILYVKGTFVKDDTFHIFVNHWKSRRGGKEKTEFKRIATAKILRSFSDKIFSENKDAKIIILGDFNDEPKNMSMNKVLFATNNKNNPKYNEFYNLFYNKSLKGKGTISRDYRWFMFDNIILSQSLTDNSDYYAENAEGFIYMPDEILYYNAKANFKIPNKTYGGKNYYGGYSDHLPVYFILKK